MHGDMKSVIIKPINESKLMLRYSVIKINTNRNFSKCFDMVISK